MSRTRMGLLSLLLAVGCSGDSTSPNVEIPAALVGQWGADLGCSPACAFRLTWTENPAGSLDVVSALGVSVSVEITEQGKFTLASGSAAPQTGTVEASGGTMYVRDSGGVVDTIDYQVDATTLRLDLRRLYYTLDFNADGQLDPARASAVLKKR